MFLFHFQLVKFGLEDEDCRLRVSCLSQHPDVTDANDAETDVDTEVDALNDAVSTLNSVDSSGMFRLNIRQALTEIFRYFSFVCNLPF